MLTTLHEPVDDVLSHYEGMDVEHLALIEFESQAKVLNAFHSTLSMGDIHLPTLLAIVSPNGELNGLLGVDPLTCSLEELHEATSDAVEEINTEKTKRWKKYVAGAVVAIGGIIATLAAAKYARKAIDLSPKEGGHLVTGAATNEKINKVFSKRPDGYVTPDIVANTKKYLEHGIAYLSAYNTDAPDKAVLSPGEVSANALTPAEKEKYRTEVMASLNKLKEHLKGVKEGSSSWRLLLHNQQRVALSIARLLG